MTKRNEMKKENTILNETLPTKMKGGEGDERTRDQNSNLFDLNINFCTAIEIEVFV